MAVKTGPKLEVTRTIETWENLTSIVPSHPSPKWIFRGVTEYPDERLIPGIARPETRKDPGNGKPGTVLPYDRDEEVKMFNEFRRLARPYFSESMTDLECLALARHHGMPTRLLDWTDSLLVASFFALEPAGTQGTKPAVYALDTNSLSVIDDTVFDPFDAKHEGVAIYRPPHINPRIPAQQGLFTVHFQPGTDPQFKPDHVEIFRLPTKPQAFKLKEALDYAGYNRASLFPDLDGLTRHIAWKHKWGKLP
jgi:hypothetical protein